MLSAVVSAAEDLVPAMTLSSSAHGMPSLARVVRLLRGAHVPVSLVRFVSRQIDPLMLEYGLEEAIGRGGMVEPLRDGAVLAILPRFGEEQPGDACVRICTRLAAVLTREAVHGPVEIEIAELHCRADDVADCEDLQLQLLAATPRVVAILAQAEGADGLR